MYISYILIYTYIVHLYILTMGTRTIICRDGSNWITYDVTAAALAVVDYDSSYEAY